MVAVFGQNKINKCVKRIFDLGITIPLMIFFAPVFFLIWFMVRMTIGRPVLFRQERPGRGGKKFVIYKFRTMTNERDKDGNLLPDAKRLKPLGHFLRKMSIDELPELFNVIKGDMSLVGPRPLLTQYLKCYTPEQARRHEIRPGITGWAQIHGRNNTPFSKRFAMDIWYIDNYSFWLDMKIIFLTIAKVFNKEGIRSDLEKCYNEVNDCGFPNDFTE